MRTRRRATLAFAGVIAVVLGCRALAPAQGKAPAREVRADAKTPARPAEAAGDAGRGDGGLTRGARAGGEGFVDAGFRPGTPGPRSRTPADAATPDAGISTEAAAGRDAGASDAGPPTREAELRHETEQLRQRLAEGDAARRALEEQVASLQSEVDAIRAEEQRVAESRERRLAALDEALVGLAQADAQLVQGTFDAQAVLSEVEAALAESLDEARAFATGFEISLTERAQSEVRQALEALDRRDFYEAMRFAQAAMIDARGAFDAANSARLSPPQLNRSIRLELPDRFLSAGPRNPSIARSLKAQMIDSAPSSVRA